jgi:RNA polymerase sigma-19 factor, ECF subfamily
MDQTIDITINEILFSEMVNAYSPRLLDIGLYISKNHQVAEDIVQDAFLKLWEQREKIDSQNIGGWLYKVVVHAAYKHQHKNAKKLKVNYFLQKGKQHSCTGVEEYLIHKEGLKMFSTIYSRLPTQQQAVYRLAHQEDLNRNEIANRLQISPNTVKNHLTKATQFIKAHLTNACLAIIILTIINLFLESTSTKMSPEDLYKANKTINKSLQLYDPKNREPFPQVQQYLGDSGY